LLITNNGNAQIPDKEISRVNPELIGMGQGLMGDNHSMLSGILGQMMGAERNVTSSIHLFSTVSDAITSQVDVNLSQAATTAENAVGNNSHSISGSLGDLNGYLTYTIWVIGQDGNISRVLVDPVNSQVLLNQSIPLKHPSMMGPGMMGPGMMGPGMMGPGMMGPGMMGPGMMGPGMIR
jgi:hypothetical protein